MAQDQRVEVEQLQLKFRIYDGTDIGHDTYLISTCVAMLKQRLFETWPQDKSVTPKSASDIKLIHAGRVLDDGRTLAESGVHIADVPEGFMTMHVVVQPLNKERIDNSSEVHSCLCSVL